jgi:histidine triad (HIT) family protein
MSRPVIRLAALVNDACAHRVYSQLFCAAFPGREHGGNMANDHGACVFCDILAGRKPGAIVHRDDVCVALLDAFPLSRGHLLIIPHQHAQHIEDLPPATTEHLFRLGADFSAVCRRGGMAPATHLLLNNGSAANQHVPHVHLHVIPRGRGSSLPMVVWRYLTRFFNPLSYVGRAKRLEREAARYRSLLREPAPLC